MLTVRDLLQGKPDVWSVSPDDTVYTALETLAAKDIGALPVLREDKLVGIFSERDYARNVVLKGRASRETKVGDVMIKNVLVVALEHTIDECMSLMTRKHVRHLPVMEKGRMVGIISIGDVVKGIIGQQSEHIQQLEDYIQGSP